MQPRPGAAGRGAIAGLVAATVLILWFLVIDLARGQPLLAPIILAGNLFGIAPESVDTGVIALYTVLHFVVFVLLGILTAWVLRAVGLGGGFLFGIIVGLLLFDAMFYLSVVATGGQVVDRLGWPAVLGGSVLAGITLVLTLRLLRATSGATLGRALREHPIVHDGLISGLAGAGVVALWFLVFDLVFREAFFTPAALGSALFYGAQGPAQVEISIATVLGYTVLHFAGFVAVGLIAAAFFRAAEREPTMILAFILVAAASAAQFFGLVALFAVWILEVLGWWTAGVGSMLGALAIVIYLWREYPQVVSRLRHEHTIEGPGMGS